MEVAAKHRIGHIKQLRLVDSSKKLIVERPSKLDLQMQGSSGMALNAVNEHEEKEIEIQEENSENRVSSLTVK